MQELILEELFKSDFRPTFFKAFVLYAGNSSWIPVPTADTSLHFQPTHPTEPDNKNLWLFNIADDPNERNDLSATRKDMVAKLLDRLAYYNSTAVPAFYPPGDPKSNPALHNNTWVPWVSGEDERVSIIEL